MTIFKHKDIVLYDTDSRVEVRVEQNPDCEEMIDISEKTNYYGFQHFSLSLDIAEELAKAMLEQVEYIKSKCEGT